MLNYNNQLNKTNMDKRRVTDEHGEYNSEEIISSLDRQANQLDFINSLQDNDEENDEEPLIVIVVG